jgi:hypothetical protein
MYEEDIKWINQGVLHFKDERFETDGQLRLTISTSTKDYKNFSYPKLNFTIQNQYQRSFTFDIIQATDLLTSLKHAFNGVDLFKENSQIVKQKMTTQFIMEFSYTRDKEKVVKIIIKHGDSDFTKVIVPVEIFQLVANTTKYFVDKYYDICMRQYSAALQGETTEVLQQLPSLIKQIPSHIMPGNYMDSSAPAEETIKETEMTIADLDDFLGADMKNVEVPELKMEKKESLTEVKSPFVEKFIKGDLRNLETILNNTSGYEEIGDKMAADLKMDVMLPGMTEEEDKSLTYISKLLISMFELRWLKFETTIPNSIPILRYRAKDFDEKHMELAYDLLLFSGYIRTVRRRLEDKISDANENKSLFHMKFRCYLDPYYFSFLEKTDRTKLSSIIINRFKYFDSIGVFKEYKNTLEMHGCSDITVQDISSYIGEVSEKAFAKTPIVELHDNLKKQNNFRIGANSNFNKEQIINEIIPLEIAEMMGQDTPNIEISDDVKKLFKGEAKVEKKVEKKNHLLRVVKTLENDIPEAHREEFLKFIESYADRNFDFDGAFPYQEFGEDLIKALYVWKPDENQRIKNSLKFYQTQIEDEIMEKEHILAIDDKKEEKEIEIDIDWDV